MERRIFGPTGRDVPVIGQGTWLIEQSDRGEAVKALQRGLELGLTHIDTAEAYGGGEAEEIVAEAIAGRRDEVFLASKVSPGNASKEGTRRACEASLERLRTDHLDLYLLHWPGPHPLEDTLEALAALKSEGLVRAFGVSNFGMDLLQQAVSIAGEGEVACNQVLYNLEERYVEDDMVDWCRRHRIALVAYSPFGKGRFPSSASRGGKVLAELAEAHGATPRQVALRFLVRDPAVFTIPKAAKPDHVESNAKAADLQLTEEELRRIDEAFPGHRRRASLPTA